MRPVEGDALRVPGRGEGRRPVPARRSAVTVTRRTPKSARACGDHQGTSVRGGVIATTGRGTSTTAARRRIGPLEDLVETGQGLLRTAGAHECAGEARHVADRGVPACLGRGVARVQQRDEAGQGADVLVVVAHDGGQWLRRPAPQEPEVAPGDLPAIDVVMALDAEERALDRLQASVVHPVPEQAPDDGQQIDIPS